MRSENFTPLVPSLLSLSFLSHCVIDALEGILWIEDLCTCLSSLSAVCLFFMYATTLMAC